MIWFVISILSILFLNTSLALSLGIENITTVAFLPIIFLILKDVILKNIEFNSEKNKIAIQILLLSLLIFSVKLLVGQDYLRIVINLFVLPMILSIYFENCSYRKIKYLKNIVLSFFVIECLLAIYERLTLSHVFIYKIEINETINNELWKFRSQSFLGHPLANSMAVSVILVFILTNKSLKIYLKLLMFLLCFFSLLCFNGRGAIIVFILIITPYFLQLIYKSTTKRYKVFFIVSSLLFLLTLFYNILNTNLGGRLIMSEKLLDGSAMTRVDVLKFYKYFKLNDLILGDLGHYMYATNKLGAAGVENGIIVLILYYGLVFTPFIIVLLFRFQLNKLKFYSQIDKWLILSVFYILGIMNPNLSTSIQWVIFVISFYAFKNYNLIHKKTLITVG